MKPFVFFLIGVITLFKVNLRAQTFSWGTVGNGEGTNGVVSVFFDDATDGKLYVGGSFTRADIITANNICSWNDTCYSAIGSGTDNLITAIYSDTSTGRLYVAGDFTMFDGQSCNGLVYIQNNVVTPIILSAQPNDEIRALVVFNGELIIGGKFTNIGPKLIKWNGTTFSNFPINATNVVSVECLKVFNNTLYVGGDFYTNFGGPDNVAKWNGSTWVDLDPVNQDMIPGKVYDIESFNNEIWVCGSFFFPGPSGLQGGIARFNGTNWLAALANQDFQSINPIASGTVVSLEVFGGSIYAANGASLTNHRSFVWKWTGGMTWQANTPGVKGMITEMAISDGTFYVAGDITLCGTDSLKMISKFDTLAQDLIDVGGGIAFPGQIRCITDYNGELFIGGYFPITAGISVTRIATWNDTLWVPLATGLNSAPTDMMRYHGDLIVSGLFTTAGGTTARKVAGWNGTSWYPLSYGMNQTVNAIVDYNDTIVAGGAFWQADNTNCNYVAYLDTSGWHQMGSGFDAPVKDLIVYNGSLYAGGQFQFVNGNPVNFLAKWNGTDWEAVGSNDLDDQVNKMYVYNNELYLAGDFIVNFTQVARWNGSSYQSLANGINTGAVRWFTESNGLLMIGGAFNNVNGNSLYSRYIAGWDGTQWYSFAAAFNSSVMCIEEYQGDMYAGGGFVTYATNVTVKYIARKYQIWLSATPQLAFRTHILLYPNPACSYVHIVVPGEPLDNDVMIYNSMGQAVLTRRFENTSEFDLEFDLPSGYYSISITRSGYSWFSSIIIK